MPTPSDVTAERASRYLHEIGAEAAPPSVDALVALHRAHVLRFSHDTVWKVRGRIPEVSTQALVEALLAGEGGGCVHLNGGFAWLLGTLGYDVTLHQARVQRAFDPEPRPEMGAHAVLTVRLDDQTWYADVGLGNGLLEPVPLREGPFSQPGGFDYALERATEPGLVWRFVHDRRLMGLRAIEFEEPASVVEDFTAALLDAATSEESISLRNVVVNSRGLDGVSTLVGPTLVRRTECRREVLTLTDAVAWEAVLREEFGLGLPGWSDVERDELWAKVTAR